MRVEAAFAPLGIFQAVGLDGTLPDFYHHWCIAETV
jgi:hypothetical protein